MTGAPGERPDLQAIAGPSSPPSADPDSLTKKEMSRDKKGAEKLTPTDRIVASFDRHLTDACKERDDLRQENRRLQSQLDQLVPECQRIKEAFSHSLFANLLATIFIAIGSTLVSTASNHPEIKIKVLWGGYGVFACGIVMLLLSTIFSVFRKKG